MATILMMRLRRKRRMRRQARAAAEAAEWAEKNRALELQPPIGFLIMDRKSRKVLTIKGGKNEPNVKVVLCGTASLSDGRFHQLWFLDESGVIRSKMNGYALEVSEKNKIVVAPYDKEKITQQWTFSEREGFLNKHMSGLHIMDQHGGFHLGSRDVAAIATGPEYQSPWEITRIA